MDIHQSFLFFQGKVKKPRSTKFTHIVDPSNTMASIQKTVTLTLKQMVTPPSTPRKNSKVLAHSQSSPMLKGAWSMRTLENAVPIIETRHKGRHCSIAINLSHCWLIIIQFNSSGTHFNKIKNENCFKKLPFANVVCKMSTCFPGLNLRGKIMSVS